MGIEVRIPNIAESISEVTVSSLLVSSGDCVQENQGILEIESDKVNQLIYAPCSGRVEWSVSVGDTVAVGSVVGTIFESESQDTLQIREQMPFSLVEQESDAQIISFPSSLRQDPPAEGKRFVPLKEIQRSDSNSRESRESMSAIRKTISRRLVQALHDSAMLTTFNEVYMGPMIALRKEKQDAFVSKYGVKLGYMSFFIKAVVDSLKKYPRVNAYIDGNEIVYRHYYDISIAVGTDRGLVVPVIRNCDQLSNGDIELQLADLASRARKGNLAIHELEGGSFTITNGGVYGSLLSTPIINPPQVGILGMHKIEKRPVVREDTIIIADMMYVAMSYDHRIIDGKEAVGFLVNIKELLEQPELLLIM
ncbi:dihydrolipoyllysine-residue succinyltransferase [Chlamydia sp.]|uniref:dihydrolipoyllysine-residue succinyltransferase n=1 Tax=Chlamydia sp. TaxID=35827 RepID=UPI0025BF83FB|nr:dihydrolipoyllysine-residue succinyltransferase [Chlamydia sp.]MBQ8498423.1 dihydrolipoyllysine-residue succinyltransferase [Chlamydia sp.]